MDLSCHGQTDRQTALALTRSVLLVGTGELLFIYLVIRQG